MLLLGSVPLSQSKPINANVVSFLNLCTKRTKQTNLQFRLLVHSQKHETPVKECFDIQARGPQKREPPGIFLVCPMVNPPLGRL